MRSRVKDVFWTVVNGVSGNKGKTGLGGERGSARFCQVPATEGRFVIFMDNKGGAHFNPV